MKKIIIENEYNQREFYNRLKKYLLNYSEHVVAPDVYELHIKSVDSNKEVGKVTLIGDKSGLAATDEISVDGIGCAIWPSFEKLLIAVDGGIFSNTHTVKIMDKVFANYGEVCALLEHTNPQKEREADLGKSM